jgi:hypothetical protein
MREGMGSIAFGTAGQRVQHGRRGASLLAPQEQPCLRPIAQGFTVCSERLLSIDRNPASQYRVHDSHGFSAYDTVSPIFGLGRTHGSVFTSQSWNSLELGNPSRLLAGCPRILWLLPLFFWGGVSIAQRSQDPTPACLVEI